MKSRVESNKLSRLGYLSVVTLMAFSLSGKVILAAEEFKLWHIGTEDKQGAALKHLSKDSDKEAAVKMITDKEFGKFVKKFTKEPFQLVEAVKEAWTKEKEKNKEAKVEDFKKSIMDEMKKVDAKEFGTESRKTAFLDLLNKLFEKGFTDKELLKKLFEDKDIKALWALLGVEAKKAEKTEEEKTEEEKKNEEKRNEEKQNKTGELSDEELKRFAQAQCDREKSQIDAFERAANDKFKQLEDTLKQLSQAQAQDNAIDPNLLAQLAQQKKNEKGIEDTLAPLLANALNDKQQEEEVPAATTQQPTFPQESRDDETDPNQFNTARPEPIPQQSGFNPFGMMNPYSAGNQVAPKLELPSESGKAALRDAQDVADANEMRQPIDATLSPTAGIPELVMAKARLKGDIQRTSIALNDAKDKAGRLEEDLEGAKEGARKFLSASTKQKLAQYEADINAKKSELQQFQQSMMMLQGENRDQYGQLLQMKQMEVGQLEQQRNQFNAQIDLLLEQGNSELATMKKRSENLNSAVKKLEGQLQGMKTDETTITQLINTNMQLQMAGQQGGVQNVNNAGRLQNFNSGRTNSPRLNIPLNSSATGTAVRGPLAK